MKLKGNKMDLCLHELSSSLPSAPFSFSPAQVKHHTSPVPTWALSIPTSGLVPTPVQSFSFTLLAA